MNHVQAGWATVDITPPLEIPMASSHPAVSVVDPLNAQAVVFKDHRGTLMLWMALDLIGISHTFSGPLVFALSSATGIPIEGVVINCSHTHSSPYACIDSTVRVESENQVLKRYEEQLGRKLVDLALQAMSDLHPVSAALHHGTSDVAINRRRPAGEDNLNAPNPDGFYNRDLWALDLHGQARHDRCIIFSYACHPVIVYRYAPGGVSADFPGSCRQHLRDELDDSVHVQFMQGLAGNVKPRAMADLETGRFAHASEQVLAAAGKQLAQDVLAALDAPGRSLEPDLGHASGWCLLPRDQSSIAQIVASLSESDKASAQQAALYWSQRIEQGPPFARVVPWSVGLVRLTEEDWIVHLGGEPLAEWLPHLRHWLNTPNVFAWGYCQDFQSYLPPDELRLEPGYETCRAPRLFRSGPGAFAPGINEIMRAGILGMRGQIQRI